MHPELVLFGKTIELYSTLTTLGQLCIFLWIFINLKEYKEISTYSNIPEAKRKPKKSNFIFKWLFPLLEITIIFLILFALNAPITPKISSIFLGDRSDNYFYNIFVLPLGLLLFGFLCKVSPVKFMDYIAPGMSLALIVFKIACFCEGCCYGVPSDKCAMFNHITERMEFPVQLVELGCAVIMFIIILIVRRKKDRKPGILYPLFMLMYCSSRFVSEFWRGDYPDIIGPLKGYHIQCIIGFIEGLILLIFVLKNGERITETFRAKKEAVLERYRYTEEDDASSNEDSENA